MPLNRSLCKLMTEGLIRDYDHLEAQFARVKNLLPHLAERDDLRKLRTELESLRPKMERSRYYVGFLGPSQAGKSTTLNSVLRPRPGEEPCTSGQGAPATSSATRIYRQMEPEVGGHGCHLRYLTPEQFQQRRGGLCSTLGFSDDETDDRILVELDALIAKAESAPEEDYGPRQVSAGDKIQDFRFFRRFLRSYGTYGKEVVREPAWEERAEFNRRVEYTNHPESDGPWKHGLLRQVEIAYLTSAISEKIELIDLPGLGARMRSDDMLTEGFLAELDGALIFQGSGQVQSKEAYDLLTKLSELYPRMRGRVWMVVTKMDTLSSAHYGYGSETTIFDHIAKTMNDKRVPLSQVLMVANEFHRRSLGPDGEPGGLPDPSLVCERLNLARDDSGQPVLPSGFAKYPELLSAFQEVMCDGGIGRLREVIGERLAEAVEGEVRDEVEGRLKSIRNRLAKLVSSARDAAQMNDGSFETAVDWKVGLQMVIQDLDEDRAMLEAPATAMAEVLSKKFEATCPARLKIEVEKLRAAHNDYVIVLEKTLRHECKSTFLPQVHDRVSDRLRTLEAQHGKVRLEDRASPTEVWEDRRLADEQSLVCLTASGAGFKLPLLFPGAEPAPLDANQYRALMPRKIRLISHRVAFVVGQRVRGHLNEMIEGLTFLKNAEGHLDAADTAPYDEVLGSLE